MSSIKILKTNDIMEILGVSRTKALQIMNLPSFPSMRLGRNFIITEDNFIRWMNENQNKEVII